MQIVVLAGGLGTRIRSVAPSTPKALIAVAGRPFVDHQLGLFASIGMSDVLICTGYMGRQIEQHVGDGRAFGVSVRYSREDGERLLGTGGALVNALPLLAPSFLVIYGDSYLTIDYHSLIAWNESRGYDAVMSVYRNENRLEPSNVTVDGDRVVRYSKVKQSGTHDHIDYGLSLFSREIIQRYADAPLPVDLGQIQNDLAGSHELGAFPIEQRFYEIGSPEGLAELEAALKGDR